MTKKSGKCKFRLPNGGTFGSSSLDFSVINGLQISGRDNLLSSLNIRSGDSESYVSRGYLEGEGSINESFIKRHLLNEGFIEHDEFKSRSINLPSVHFPTLKLQNRSLQNENKVTESVRNSEEASLKDSVKEIKVRKNSSNSILINITRSVVSFLNKIPKDKPKELTKLLNLQEKKGVELESLGCKSESLRGYVGTVLKVSEGIHHDDLSRRIVRPSRPGPLRFVAGEVLEKIHNEYNKNGCLDIKKIKEYFKKPSYNSNSVWKIISVFVGIGLLSPNHEVNKKKFKEAYENYSNGIGKKFCESQRKVSEKGGRLEDIAMRVVRLLKENRSICENSEGVVTSTSVAKALCANPSENLCHKVMLVLSVLEEEHRDSRIRSDSNIRSCAKDFVNFIQQHIEPNNKEWLKWENLAKALKESNKNCEQDVCAIRSILLGAEIIKCTERKDGRFVSIFVSIKNKDSFEKLLNSLNSKTLKSIIIEKEKREKEDGLKDITMRIVHLLKKNRSICENSKGIVTSTSVAKALRMNPSKGLYHKVMLVLNVLADTPSDFGIRSNSSVVRSCARDFVNEFNNGKRVKWENLSKDLKGHDERSVCDVKNILIGAGIIEYTEKKDGRFVSIKNKDKFEKLRNSLDSKILKNTSQRKRKVCHK